MTSNTEQVTQHIQNLEKPFAELVEKVRQVILNANVEIGEQIKWNSPSFYYTGEMKAFDAKEYKRDIVVMHLRKNKILLIFPTGAIIENTSGILEGDYSDGRRMISINNLTDVDTKATALHTILNQWLTLVDK